MQSTHNVRIYYAVFFVCLSMTTLKIGVHKSPQSLSRLGLQIDHEKIIKTVHDIGKEIRNMPKGNQIL